MTTASPPATLAELIGAAVGDPSATALLAPGRMPLSHGELQRQVRSHGDRLRAAGLGRGDVAALVVDNGPEAASAFLTLAATAVCAPLNPAYREAELEFYLDDLGARLVVVGRDTTSPVREVAARRGIEVVELVPGEGGEAGAFELVGLPPPAAAVPAGLADPGDVALMLHTSGTTSRPKLVPLTHRNLCRSAANVASVLQLTPADRCLNVMPLFHIHGLVAALLASLANGASVACTPGFHPVSIFAWARELQPTWLTAVPTMLQSVLERARDDREALSSLAGLRLVRSSSAALPVPVAAELESVLGVPVLQAYGMTEAAHQMASNRLPPVRRLPGSVGAAAGPAIAILDEGGSELASGETGEVAIRGENVFAGYAHNPEANAAAFTNGWFRTGDEGFLDEHGMLYLSGRIKEIINRGGEKIAPVEVDDVLLRHPAVAQAVTFAIADPRLGEEVGAAVVLAPEGSTDERELQDFVAQTLAPFKVPRVIVIVDAIPKGPTGKLQRIGLDRRLGVVSPASGRGTATATAALPFTYPERLVAKVWSDVLGIPGIGRDDDFFALGGDSVLGAEAVARIRDLTGKSDLPLVSIVRAPTVASFVVEPAPDAVQSASSLVTIAEGGGRPFFLVHGLDGDVIGFAALARRVADGRPFYGLRALTLEDGRLGHRSVVEMAAAYVDEVVRVQPTGPYLLGGVCAGGPIAVEMGRVLHERGERVDRLVLIDPRLRAARTPSYYAWRLRSAASRGRARELVAGRLRHALGRGTARRPPGPPTLEADIAAVRDAYVLRPLDIPAAVLMSDDYDDLGVPASAWVRALAGARLLRFAGAHEHLFLPPAVDQLAALLRGVLDEGDA